LIRSLLLTNSLRRNPHEQLVSLMRLPDDRNKHEPPDGCEWRDGWLVVRCIRRVAPFTRRVVSNASA
jgi:hypothetical protein